METYSLQVSDGKTIFCRKWLPSPTIKPVAVVQIIHGLAEHSKRYDWFANRMADKGILVYTHDHRGHGHTETHPDDFGFFAENGGWDRVVADIKELGDRIRKENQDLPFFLFGHSMGSFFARDCLARFAGDYKGVVLSGTAGPPGFSGLVGLMLARLGMLLKGPRKPNGAIDNLFFGSYAKAFKPNRTPFDWLSHDPDQVDAYINDPLCGFICSSRLYADLASGIITISSPGHFARTPVELPIRIFSGSMDPVGGFSKGVLAVYEAYKHAGVRDLTLKLYEEGRHEMLNEINREEVADDVIQWIMNHL